MAIIPVTQAAVFGLDEVPFVAADPAGDNAPLGGAGIFLAARNTDVVTRTVTVDTPITVRGLVVANPAMDIPAGEVAIMPLVVAVFGTVPAWTYSDPTGVQVAVIQLGR